MTSIADTSSLMDKAAVSDRFGRAAPSYDEMQALAALSDQDKLVMLQLGHRVLKKVSMSYTQMQ